MPKKNTQSKTYPMSMLHVKNFTKARSVNSCVGVNNNSTTKQKLKSSVFGYYDLDHKISEDRDQDMNTQDSVRIMCDKEGNLIDANMVIRGKDFKPNQSADDVLAIVNGTPSDGHDASSRLAQVDKALDTTWFEEHYTIYTDKGSVTLVALYVNTDEEDELGLEQVTNVSHIHYELDRPGTGIFKDVKEAVINYDNDKSSDFNVGPHLIPIGFSIPLQNST